MMDIDINSPLGNGETSPQCLITVHIVQMRIVFFGIEQSIGLYPILANEHAETNMSMSHI